MEEPSYVENSVPDRLVRTMESLGFKLIGERDRDHLSRTTLVFTGRHPEAEVYTTVSVEDFLELPTDGIAQKAGHPFVPQQSGELRAIPICGKCGEPATRHARLSEP